MFSYLLSLMLALTPTATGGNGNHWGWRNNQQPRTVPQVQVVTPKPPSSSPIQGNNAPVGDPNPSPFTYLN